MSTRPDIIAGLALALSLAVGPAMARAPLFTDRTGQIEHVYDGGWQYFVGGGAAVFDCSGDGRPEIFAAGGANPSVLLRNDAAAPGAAPTFHEATPEALALTGATGAYALHLDADENPDLVVLRNGENRVLLGRGNCEFEDATETLGLAGSEAWTTAFSATWEAGNRLPTLAFGHYVDLKNPDGPFEACDSNLLYRPAGDAYDAPIRLAPGFCALSMLFSDWGRHGRADLRISNDRHYYVKGGEEQLWRMTAEPTLYTTADGWRSFVLWGMGIASRDIDGDGRPEIYLSSMGDQRLQALDAGANTPTYHDVEFERGTTAQRPHAGEDGRPSTGWQIAFGDVDNDGRDDVFIAKGNVDQMPENAMLDPNSLLMQQPDGSFREASVAAGLATMARSRGGVLADLNGDGRLDLVVTNRRANIEIHENATPDAGAWLEVLLRQDGPNIAALGAWIELRAGSGATQSREITVGGGHAGGVLGPEHFGLGAAEAAQIRVIWPDGAASAWREVAANRSILVRRGAGDSLAIEPAR